MTQPRTLVTFIFCCFAAAAPVSSQERPATPMVDPNACAQGQRLQPGEQTPRVPNQSGETLSDRLARSDGVLCPPEIDPAIRVSTPEAGRTPIIPPPGGPGGDQDVRPK